MIAYVFISFLFFSTYVRTDRQKALIFHAGTLSIAEKQDVQSTTHGAYSYACPAESPDEKEQNSKSISKNSLFVKEMVGAQGLEDKEICAEPYKPSILYHREEHIARYEIGYEIYYDSERFKHLPYNEKNFYKPITLNKAKQIINSVIPPHATPEYIKNEEKYWFMWLPILMIEFNDKLITPKKVEYKRDTGDQRAKEVCQNFNVEETMQKILPIDSFYEEENQKALFQDVEMLVDPGCGQNRSCFVKYPVISSKYFNTRASALSTCSNFNTIPIWQVIAEGWLRVVEDFLYVVSEVLGKNLHIISGFGDVLTLTGTDKKPREMFLKQKLLKKKKKIPVPKFMYKIVEYYFHDINPTTTPFFEPDHFVILLVIHNDPTENEIKRICDPIDESFGWNGIENSNIRIGFTYVCAADQNTFNNLSIDYKKKSIKTLNLSNTPILNGETQKVEYHDFRPDIGDSFDWTADKEVTEMTLNHNPK